MFVCFVKWCENSFWCGGLNKFSQEFYIRIMGFISFKLATIVLVFLVLGILQQVSCSDRRIHRRPKRQIEWGPDIAGPYCEKRYRRGSCCPGRMDDCSVPLLDTLCYCDDFCNRTRGDCCPDYFSFCLGVAPTPEPIRGKTTFREYYVSFNKGILN